MCVVINILSILWHTLRGEVSKLGSRVVAAYCISVFRYSVALLLPVEIPVLAAISSNFLCRADMAQRHKRAGRMNATSIGVEGTHKPEVLFLDWLDCLWSEAAGRRSRAKMRGEAQAPCGHVLGDVAT